MSQHAVIVTAGGTGGHIFPALAVARQLQKEGKKVHFITDKRFAGYASHAEGIDVHYVCAKSPSGSLLNKVCALFLLTTGLYQSLFLVLRFRASHVIGFGGYPSFPALAAGLLLRRHIIVHEQNAILGRVNRFFAKHIQYLCLSFEKTAAIPDGISAQLQVTGNPIRDAILQQRETALPSQDESIEILITGGSQGARVFSEIVPAALEELPRDMLENVRIYHQVSASDEHALARRYQALGVTYHLAPFFEDMAVRLASCHFAIMRGGASSVTELQIVGRGSILIPLNHAMDKHQHANIASMVNANAAIMVEENDEVQAQMVKALTAMLGEQRRYKVMAKAAHHMAKLDAVQEIAKLL